MNPTADTLCPGCFADKGRANPCPHCGYDETIEHGPLVLPHRAVLHGQFVVGRVLGKPGGFGITYLGWDLNLQTRVAIKEFLPRDLAGRATDRATVAAHSGDDGEQFRFGLVQFIREARTLAQLDHPNIVRVRQFFEANGTAYLVMDYYQGFSLAEYLDQQGGRIPEEQAKQLMLPILDGLRAVHAKGFLHRDIKPQNIYLARLDSGGVRPILLDFGAARQAMGERSRSLSVVVSPGYAPFEQYHRKGHQGPWTDIYSAAAVLYRMVTGEAPPEANERMVGDDLRPATDFGASRTLSGALDLGLAMAPEERPQVVQTFQALLLNDVPLLPPTPSVPVGSSTAHPPTPPSTPHRWWPAAVVLTLVLAGLGGWSIDRQTWLAALPQAQPDARDREHAAERAAAALREADLGAFVVAAQTDTVAAYQNYLAGCAASGCVKAADAKARLRTLQEEAERQARTREEATRQAPAHAEAQRLAADREERDARAFETALSNNTEAGYQTYLDGCGNYGCGHRAEAQKRLDDRVAERQAIQNRLATRNGAWLVVAGSYPHADDSAAERRRLAIIRSEQDAVVIDSNEYPLLTPNLRVVAIGPFESKEMAKASLTRVKLVVPDAYVKKGR